MSSRRGGWDGLVLGAALVVLTVPAVVVSQDHGPVFPNAFVVEHAIVQTGDDGSVFTGEPVVDTYVGSRIVSERADGSRLIIDFARRELTEIRTGDGRYTVMGFDRMAQLIRELNDIERGDELTQLKAARGQPEPRFRVVEVDSEPSTKSTRSPQTLIGRTGVRHLRVLHEEAGGLAERSVLDVWFDADVRIGPRGMSALDEFETEILSAASVGAVTPRALAAARREAGGAVPILTSRPLSSAREANGTIEDVAHRVDRVENVPAELLTVPDGFQRVPHPLELMVAHARSEAELNRRMSGERAEK